MVVESAVCSKTFVHRQLYYAIGTRYTIPRQNIFCHALYYIVTWFIRFVFESMLTIDLNILWW